MIRCALLAVALLAYTYVGYPIVIGVLARLFPRKRAVSDDAELPTVTVCLPVFNAASYLPAKIESLLAQDYPAERVQILITCDGCTDSSEAVARELAASPAAGGRIRVLVAPGRSGKPTALNSMSAQATGDLLLLNDVRQPLARTAMRALARELSDPAVGVATGNLVLAGAAGSGVYWRYENWIREQESRFRGVVGMTGPIAMMRRADFAPLPPDIILDDVWIPMQLGLAGKRVAFVAEAEARDAAFEDDREFKRKARTLAGNYQLFARLPALLSPLANRIWFETFSHKIMRLLAPWILLWLAAVSVLGATSATAPTATVVLLRALLIAQALFYLAAAAGRRAGRLGGLARTFVVLNSAALVGLWRYLSGRQRITW
ncbi:MAG TPA: glycosyltransferase family 2 protein [Polyangia bacterium]|nr:glycosyltransferase family 2 protein [Polyangia bacterium]